MIIWVKENDMEKINFSECKVKFFGRPLHCRPLRDIIPEKQQAEEPSTPRSTGTKQNKIPGLPSSAQPKAWLDEKKERRKKSWKRIEN